MQVKQPIDVHYLAECFVAAVFIAALVSGWVYCLIKHEWIGVVFLGVILASVEMKLKRD